SRNASMPVMCVFRVPGGIVWQCCFRPVYSELPTQTRLPRRTRLTMRRLAPVVLLLALPASAAAAPPTFERDIQPILTRAGCNAGACHGKARGQNGFQLSLLAFDNDFDYHAITAEARGRRIFPASPGESLLLRKASGQVPHGGGKRLPVDGAAYRALADWIPAGCPPT